ncbi:unnamed protein product [Amoebophrya sp. A25]|nr:unnamed protein product [Amoebophrya sp. A25]|eukprot:GSA25T00006781001.1
MTPQHIMSRMKLHQRNARRCSSVVLMSRRQWRYPVMATSTRAFSSSNSSSNSTSSSPDASPPPEDPFDRIQPDKPEEDWYGRVRQRHQRFSDDGTGVEDSTTPRDTSASSSSDSSSMTSTSSSSFRSGTRSSSRHERRENLGFGDKEPEYNLGRGGDTHTTSSSSTSQEESGSTFSKSSSSSSESEYATPDAEHDGHEHRRHQGQSPAVEEKFEARKHFAFDFYPHWYLGHMSKARVEIKKRVDRGVNLLLEIRDARAPFSSCQYELLEELGFRREHEERLHPIPENVARRKLKKLTIFNKVDLIKASDARRILGIMRELRKPALLISAQEQVNMRRIREFVIENCDVKHPTVGLWMMVIGMPNVGKSTIINGLKQDAWNLSQLDPSLTAGVRMDYQATTNPLPGTTKHCKGQSTFAISKKPLIHVIDSPGMMLLKNVENLERQTNLCLLGCMPDHIVGEFYVADYLLFKLNQLGNHRYAQVLDLPDKKPTNSIDLVVRHVAQIMQPELPSIDLLAGVRWFLKLFRQGHFGPVMLDELPKSNDEVMLGTKRVFVTEPPNPWTEKYNIRRYQ